MTEQFPYGGFKPLTGKDAKSSARNGNLSPVLIGKQDANNGEVAESAEPHKNTRAGIVRLTQVRSSAGYCAREAEMPCFQPVLLSLVHGISIGVFESQTSVFQALKPWMFAMQESHGWEGFGWESLGLEGVGFLL